MIWIYWRKQKMFLFSNFDMKYMGGVSYVIEIEIHKDR
jgi:hypothetical protein